MAVALLILMYLLLQLLGFTATAEGASEVKFHSSGLGWSADAQVVAVSNGDGSWTATVDPGFAAGVEYKWIVDGVEEDLATPYRAGECADDNVAEYSDTWFNRTWAVGAGDVTGDVAGACSGSSDGGSGDGSGDDSEPADPTAGEFSEAFGGTTIGEGGVYIPKWCRRLGWFCQHEYCFVSNELL